MPESGAPLFLIAGGRDAVLAKGPDPLVQAALRSSSIRRPRVAYVGAASGDNTAFRLLIGRILEKAGAGTVTLAPLCGRRGSLKSAEPVLEEADIVFVSGGDVEAGMRVLEEKGAVARLRRLHRAGKPFFGVSAGSIMLARRWVRWTNPSDDSSAELFNCMGFAPLLCDTHGEADGWGELQTLLSLSPVGSTAYGICSGSALVVRGRSEIAALGREVHVFRRRKGGVVRVDDLQPTNASP